MKSKRFLLLTIFLLSMICISCGDNGSASKLENDADAPVPSFTIGVKPLQISNKLPFLQSFAWARMGNKILLIGGRIEGFHGLVTLDTLFKTKKANQSIFVIDLSDYSYSEMPLNMKDKDLLQFASTNMEFCQSGDTLYLAGGFGTQNVGDLQSNYTFNRMVSISVSEMINQVSLQKNGNPYKAIIGMASSPFVQVTGGEMVFENNNFYLLFGQNYNGAYNVSVTGNYTSAIRKFSFNGSIIGDTVSYFDTLMHRRDIPVAEIFQKSGNFHAGFGGVFNSKDNGYVNPVYISFHGNNNSVKADTLTQKTNQYACAVANIYDPVSDANITTLLGGIGRYQFMEKTQTWQDGDDGAKLPFVKTITQMTYHNGVMHQNIQLPPLAPELPALIGANAIFIADSNYIYSNNTIDYSKITSSETKIGIMYGGIKSIKPSSSYTYPTSLNSTIYEVYLYKSSSSKK